MKLKVSQVTHKIIHPFNKCLIPISIFWNSQQMPAKGIMKKEQNINMEKENEDTEHIYEEISIISSSNLPLSDSTVKEITFDETPKVCMKW